MNTFDPLEAMAESRHEFGEHGGVNMCIEASTTFTVLQADTLPHIFHGEQGPKQGCYLYGRHFNPTVLTLGRQLAAMEGTEAAYATASGMSAITNTVLQICKAGDHVVVGDTIYGGTYAFFRHYLPEKTGIEVTFVPQTDLAAVEAACTERTKLLYVEGMANPTLAVADLPALADIAHACGAKLVVDNTFSPLILSPARHGADIVVHSLTKYINGASDIIAGAICASDEFIGSLMDVSHGSLMLLGPVMDPHSAFEISLRLPHLGMRMVEHSHRALVFAERLQEMGVSVVYPGLPEHPHHELLTRLANPGFGYGGIFGVDMGDADRADRFMEILQSRRFGMMAVSLGYFDTLMSASAHSTSSELSEEEQKKAGITQGLVRISVGYSGTLEQRWQQLKESVIELQNSYTAVA